MNTSLTKEVFVNSYAADQKNSIEFGKEEEVLFLSNNEAEFIFSMSIYENGLKSRKINWIRIFFYRVVYEPNRIRKTFIIVTMFDSNK